MQPLSLHFARKRHNARVQPRLTRRTLCGSKAADGSNVGCNDLLGVCSAKPTWQRCRIDFSVGAGDDGDNAAADNEPNQIRESMQNRPARFTNKLLINERRFRKHCDDRLEFVKESLAETEMLRLVPLQRFGDVSFSSRSDMN